LLRMQSSCNRAIRFLISGCLALAVCAGCSKVGDAFHAGDRDTSAQIERSYRQGQYQRSLEQCAAVIAQHPGSAVYDRALYYAGLNLVQLGPASDNYSRALHYFQKLLQERPDSALIDESTAWVKLLSLSAQTHRELQQRQSQISQYGGLYDEQARQIVRLKAENERLKKELELLKKVDLQLQQQKKDMHNAGKP
jgi:hypothetical protein